MTQSEIKATDLRIGNWVNVPRADQSPFRIDGFEFLRPDSCKIYQDSGMEWDSPFGKIKGHPLTWELKDLSPIPLTPEILEKAGFKYLEYRNKFQKTGFDFQLEEQTDVDDLRLLYGCENFGVRIHFVHQLQNLYFALTGTELTIRL